MTALLPDCKDRARLDALFASFLAAKEHAIGYPLVCRQRLLAAKESETPSGQPVLLLVENAEVLHKRLTITSRITKTPSMGFPA